ncbi:MAG: UDP-3-O-(3-hydroxymyristoyl)glucosamine N-acyltransferase [Opitutaceae bacterium]|jgi:UDP-3-O-[3-hydroxymyristoyl] glucosamine N-acyltransferase
MQLAFTAADLVAFFKPRAQRGATTETLRGIAALAAAQPGDLSFLGNSKYRSEVGATAASVVLLPADYAGEPRLNQLFLLVDNPSVALARFCSHLEQQLWPRPAPGVHSTAHVAPGARIAATATVGPLCVVEEGAVVGERVYLQGQVFVGRGAQIGDDGWLMPGVIVAAECVLGRRVRLQPGVVIGSDGFGYELVAGRHEKVPQVGAVLVGDDVEIGANTTVDRARFSRTVIGEGTKIDNLVQIGHNVVIGKHCLICGQAGVSGSTTLGDYVVLGGQAGLVGHITLGRGAQVGAQAGVTSDLAPGVAVRGSPSLPYMLEQRLTVLRNRLPDLFRRVGEIEEQLKKPSAGR